MIGANVVSRAKHFEAADELRHFKPYPAYKDSGVEWLGQIPAHWEVKRMRHVVNRIEQGWSPDCDNREADDDEWGVLKAGCVNRGLFVESEHKALPPSVSPIPELEVREGDLLMSRASGSRDLVGSVAVVSHCRRRLLLCDKVFRLHVDTDTAHRQFLAHSMNSRIARWQIEVVLSGGNGLANNIAQEVVKDLVVPQPPPHEQCEIAAYLNSETARIDALVAKKEQLIELLQEKRTALITRAVTKGLDPNVLMKGSGVDWLGEIPRHWEVNRTKFAARLRSGHTPSRQHPEYWKDCTIPWFGLADVWQIRDGQIEYASETTEKISELGLANSAARLLPKGTVLLSRTASVGFSAIMGVDMATTQDFVNWVCGPTLRPEYLLYVFRSMQHEFSRLTMGSTHQTIYMPDVGRFSTPIPPRAEQDQIVAFVREETSKTDALIAKVREAIDRLNELRTALISAAVTGKIDVRAEVA